MCFDSGISCRFWANTLIILTFLDPRSCNGQNLFLNMNDNGCIEVTKKRTGLELCSAVCAEMFYLVTDVDPLDTAWLASSL